jgi:hypothetical protein
MKRNLLIIIALYSIVATLTILFFNGTGDDGDSIMHYLFARFAPALPRLYFDHWAKPLFVLLASPFSQFGFIGIKVFNALVTLAAICLTYLTAERLKMPNSLLTALFLIVTPGYYILTYSGLTEPLFALVLILGVYLCLRDKFILSMLVISFLPFVRSEGLIICGVFGAYLIFTRRFKYIPLLLAGHIVYSIAGYPVYHNILWVFTENPYSTLKHVYGSGKLFHFVDQMQYIAGLPLYILFWAGVLASLFRIRNFGHDLFYWVIVMGSFFAFFVAHSLFWYFGIFGSMGLNRVLVGVMPLAAIIALKGFNLLLGIGRKPLRIAFQGLIIAYVIIFPFTSNNAAVNFKSTMVLTDKQEDAVKLSKDIKPLINGHKVLCSYPFLVMELDFNPFLELANGAVQSPLIDIQKPGDFAIWDIWYVGSNNGVTKDGLLRRADIEMLKTYKNEKGEDEFIVFRKR